jgi:hypothetical protein
MKKIFEGEMPDDFWNYLVNPITGYYIEHRNKNEYNEEIARKYAKTPQSI